MSYIIVLLLLLAQAGYSPPVDIIDANKKCFRESNIIHLKFSVYIIRHDYKRTSFEGLKKPPGAAAADDGDSK